MKLRRFCIESRIIIAVFYKSRWVQINLLSGFSDLPQDMIYVLDKWKTIQPELISVLNKTDDDNLPYVPENILPMLPFEPKSFRDFMLSETHAIDAGHGMVKRFLPALYPLIIAYEKMTKRTFPALKPKPVWYRQPIYYMGNHLNFLTDGAEVKWPEFTSALDYELELGFVITKPLKDAGKKEALDAIGGFVIFNDISARDVQIDEMRSGLGPQKAKHFINVMSANVIPAGEIMPFLDSLSGEVRINGVNVCTTKVDFRHHRIEDVLMHVSMGEQLHPGEMFAMGTLPGGCALENDHWLKPGDRIELFIERVGTLTNTIVK